MNTQPLSEMETIARNATLRIESAKVKQRMLLATASIMICVVFLAIGTYSSALKEINATFARNAAVRQSFRDRIIALEHDLYRKADADALESRVLALERRIELKSAVAP